MPSLKAFVSAVLATELILGGAAYNLRVGLISGIVPVVRANAVRGNDNAAPPEKRFYADLFIDDVVGAKDDADLVEMAKAEAKDGAKDGAKDEAKSAAKEKRDGGVNPA